MMMKLATPQEKELDQLCMLTNFIAFSSNSCFHLTKPILSEVHVQTHDPVPDFAALVLLHLLYLHCCFGVISCFTPLSLFLDQLLYILRVTASNEILVSNTK